MTRRTKQTGQSWMKSFKGSIQRSLHNSSRADTAPPNREQNNSMCHRSPASRRSVNSLLKQSDSQEPSAPQRLRLLRRIDIQDGDTKWDMYTLDSHIHRHPFSIQLEKPLKSFDEEERCNDMPLMRFASKSFGPFAGRLVRL